MQFPKMLCPTIYVRQKRKKKVEQKVELADNYSKILANIELINFIESNILKNCDVVLDIHFFNTTHHAILMVRHTTQY